MARPSTFDSEAFTARSQLVQLKIQVKIFGMILDARLNYKEHIAGAAVKWSKAMMELQRLRDPILTTARQLFAAKVVPVMDHVSKEWIHACA
uniref:WGS project CBMI000000000 data, contig CS3069_c001162 n=1 Tax=Fusarium clavum TaxID=2594811 RepID=A0A090MBC7_9HYPO|nr:unnamed protein product [Fusarium clavum]